MAFTHVIFDVDGTLVDTLYGVHESYLVVCREMGLTPNEEAYQKNAGIRTPKVFVDYYGMDEEEFAKARVIYGKSYEALAKFDNDTFPGVKEMLMDLQARGIKVAVATARTKDVAVRMFRDPEIANYLGYIATAPHSTSLDVDKVPTVLTCVEALHAKPEECVMVGDRFVDIRGGKGAGTKTIGVTYGFGTRKEMEEEQADYIVDTVEELHKLLVGE